MGRKIPGRKHKGVKDPLQQQAKRNATLLNIVNAPPKVIDFQEVPKSVKCLIKISKAVQDGTIKRKKKKKKNQNRGLINTDDLIGKEIKLPGMTKAEKPIPSFVQRPEETDSHFLHRINQACHDVIQEAKFEAKYGVNVNMNPDTGEMSITKKPREVVDEIEKPPCKKQKKGGVKQSDKKERRKQKLEEIKKAKLDNHRDDFEGFRDDVKFGEVVHAPPTIKALPKKAESKESTKRPGRKDLLLKPMLQTMAQPISTFSKKIKRKTLPSATQRQLELQRIQAVKAYRILKAQK